MVDLVSIFVNLSQSLAPVQTLLTGFGYIMGISFVMISVSKFRKIGDARAHSHSQEKMFVPTAYFLVGIGLIFLPTTINALANTAFGNDNILAYSSDDEDNLTAAVKLLIQTTGVLWFVRGSVLLAHASEPGVKEGSKGLTFIVAGIFALNFDNTTAAIDYALTHFFALVSAGKTTSGG